METFHNMVRQKNENNLLSSYEATAERRKRRRRKNDSTAPAAGEESQTLRWEIWGSHLVATLAGLEPATSKPWQPQERRATTLRSGWILYDPFGD